MIFPNIDVFTMQVMVAITHLVFLVVLIQLSRKNKDIKGIKWWLYASILLTIETNTTLFPEIRSNQIVSIFLNLSGILSYISLMIGFFQFSNKKLHAFIPCAIIVIYFIASISSTLFEYGVMTRIYTIGLLISLTIAFSIKSIFALNHKFFIVEKCFLIILLAIHIGVYMSWAVVDLGLQYGLKSYLAISLVSIYIIDAMIFINIFLLIIAKKRERLNLENEKYKSAQREIATAISDANIAAKTKTIFLSNFSHELMTPLNSIIGFSEVFKTEIGKHLNDKQQEFIDYIHTTANKLLLVITALVDLSNLETRQITVDSKAVDGSIFVMGFLPDLHKELLKNNRKIEIVNSNDIDQPRMINIDEKILTKILLNLIANAISYSSDDSVIVFRYGISDTGKYRFSIIDHGVGIDEKYYGNVFKPFIKSIYGITQSGSTVIGLALAKGLTDLMDGEINFKSTLEQGTEFWVEFSLQ